MPKHKILFTLFSCLAVYIIDGCTVIQQDPPITTSASTFSIPMPKEANTCFLMHQYTGAPTTKINLFFDVISYYFNGSRKVIIDEKTVTINPNNTSFPISVTLNMAADRPCLIEANVEGTVCSECGSGYSIDGPSGNTTCINFYQQSANGYLAATPRWNCGKSVQVFAATQALPIPERIPNKPKSCNCIVN